MYVARAALAPCPGGAAGDEPSIESGRSIESGQNIESGEVDIEAGWVALRILAPPASANERLVLWSGNPPP